MTVTLGKGPMLDSECVEECLHGCGLEEWPMHVSENGEGL